MLYTVKEVVNIRFLAYNNPVDAMGRFFEFVKTALSTLVEYFGKLVEEMFKAGEQLLKQTEVINSYLEVLIPSEFAVVVGVMVGIAVIYKYLGAS